jgi:uncharacterized protein (TIGR03437 family)
VIPNSPASRGELIIALGTGFGPFHPQPPDGFAVRVSSTIHWPTRTQLEFAGKVIQPDFVGAAPGRVARTALRFKIGDLFPAASTIEIKVQVNGHESNTVQLPLE